MARPIKKGLEYFPLDVLLEDNVELLEAEYGLIGYAILIKLWQKIYANGYYIEWEDDHALLFSRKINTVLTTVNDVVNACFKRNLFNEDMYKKHKILTSAGIQKRYSKVCSDARRKNISIYEGYLLINTTLTVVNAEGTPVNPVASTQSKVNKSKVNKSTTGGINSEDNSNDENLETSDSFFEKCWAMYPEQMGMNEIDESQKQVLFELGDEFIRCIERYITTVETKRNNGFTQLNYKHGSTFFKTGYEDFLDATYVPTEKRKPKATKNNFHNFEQDTDQYTSEELEVVLGTKKITIDGRNREQVLKGVS